MTNFLLVEWIKVELTSQLQEKTLFFINSKECFKITTESACEIVSLRNTQEVADTLIIFHAEHISTQYTEPPHTRNTDVVLLALAFDKNINSPLYKNWQ